MRGTRGGRLLSVFGSGPFPTPSGILTRVALAVYALMALASLWVLWERGRLGLLGADPSSGLGRRGLAADVAGGLGLGWAIGVLTVIFLHVAWSDRPWSHFLEDRLREFLEGLTRREALVLALASGVGEELLFRGVLLDVLSDWRGPWVGWLVSSLVFGLLHSGPDWRFLPWTIFATGMGLVLGALFLGTGSLLAPIATHAVINGLHLVEEADRQSLEGPRRGRPGGRLVSPREDR